LHTKLACGDRLGGVSAEILGGNADRCENKGVAEKATQKMLKGKGIKIDGAQKRGCFAGKRKEEAGTLSAEPWARDYRIRYYLSSEKLKTVN